LARQRAEASEQIAVVAQANEAKLREQAETAALAARRRAYASDMNVAKLALDGNNLGRALDLLKSQRPQDGQLDLRDWEWRYLWQQTRSDALYTLCKQSDEICGMSVSARGDLVAVGGYHGAGVSVWDLNSGREWGERLAEDERQFLIAFSPVGPWLAFTGVANVPIKNKSPFTLHIYNVETRQMISNIPLDNLCDNLVFSKDGKTLITSSQYPGTITLWSVPDGTQLKSIHCQMDAGGPATTSFAVSPDLNLAAFFRGKTIHVMDLHDESERWSAQASKSIITALAFSPDGKTLASAAGWTEKDIRLWDVDTGKMIGTLEGHGAFVSSMVFWPDGSKLASSSGDQTIRIWDVASRTCIDTLVGHRLEVWRLALLPDGHTLVSASKDGEVCVWDTFVNHPRCSRITIPGKVDAWCFDSNQSVLTFQNGSIVQWSGKNFGLSERILDIDVSQYEFDGYYPPIFSEDGHYLAVAYTNRTIKVWDLQRHAILKQEMPGLRPFGFFEDGSLLATLNWTDIMETVDAWDLSGKRKIHSWEITGFIGQFPIAMPPNKHQLTCIDWEGRAISANLADGSGTKLDLNVYEVGNIAYSPGGKWLAVASSMGFAEVWDASSWKPITTLGGYLVGVSSVAFSPDGKRLATGSDDPQTLRLWDTASWRDTITLDGDGGSFVQAAFSPDGNTIGCWNRDRSLYLWHAPSMEEIEAEEQ